MIQGHTRYSENMADVMADLGQREWIEEELSSLDR